ncbi:Phosphonoacetaldehyde hydrolase OS=Lysinibacillus sphaericus OX=1421 GN=phnX PE=3 SV=1 [Lysinibacillus sphaericus]
MKIEAVIFDWAGTAVDFGCFAPVNVFLTIFEDAGVAVTLEEARKPMGMLKIDHIRTMLEMPRVSEAWARVYGRSFTEQDVQALYSQFETKLMASLAKYTDRFHM